MDVLKYGMFLEEPKMFGDADCNTVVKASLERRKEKD